MEPSFTVVGLGELIWDCLPEGRQLGGAPTNFAYVSHLLGHRAVVASRVGDDALGEEAVARLAERGLETAFLQIDEEHPTGTVGVTVGADGEPHFRVNPNSAWDYLEWTPAWAQLAASADAVCFGTMAQRKERARDTVKLFLAHTREDAVRLFDVNLRHDFFTPDMLRHSLAAATHVKINHHECAVVASMLDIESGDGLDVARHFVRAFNVSLVAVTRGEGGSLLVTADEESEHDGFHQTQIVDTIGAGDAFAAALAHACLVRAPLHKIAAAANRLGAWLVTQCGATPAPDRALLDTVKRMLE